MSEVSNLLNTRGFHISNQNEIAPAGNYILNVNNKQNDLQFIYSQRQNFIARSHFMKQNADFQDGISQA